MNIAIFGASGFAMEISSLAKLCNKTVVAFIDHHHSSKIGQTINGIPVIDIDTFILQHQNTPAVLAVGSPTLRKKLYSQARTNNINVIGLTHPSIQIEESNSISSDAIICAGSILTNNIKIGCGVQINMACTIAHDVTINEFSTVSPGSLISGNVCIGSHVFIGTGTIIIDGTPDNPIIIGDNSFISAGCCITKSIPPNAHVTAVPSRYIK